MIFVFEKNLAFAQGRVAKNVLVRGTRNCYFKQQVIVPEQKLRRRSVAFQTWSVIGERNNR